MQGLCEAPNLGSIYLFDRPTGDFMLSATRAEKCEHDAVIGIRFSSQP